MQVVDDDISALVDGSQRLSVGTDGWRSYVNSSNNEADMVSLAIRLPDGRRNCIKIPKMTPLKVIFHASEFPRNTSALSKAAQAVRY